MTNNTPAVNSSGDVATLFGQPEKVSRHRATNQSAAMDAALMVGFQYSHTSKSLFRRMCLENLKASLAPNQKASA